MSECNFLNGCMFFNDKIKNMPKVVETMKKLYCLWHYKQCARYRVTSTLSKKEVPEDLFPSDTIRAKIIIAHHYHLPY